jgi:hypothetical protein
MDSPEAIRVKLEYSLGKCMYRWRDKCKEGESFFGMGRVSACLVEVHVQVERCTGMG